MQAVLVTLFWSAPSGCGVLLPGDGMGSASGLVRWSKLASDLLQICFRLRRSLAPSRRCPTSTFGSSLVTGMRWTDTFAGRALPLLNKTVHLYLSSYAIARVREMENRRSAKFGSWYHHTRLFQESRHLKLRFGQRWGEGLTCIDNSGRLPGATVSKLVVQFTVRSCIVKFRR